MKILTLTATLLLATLVHAQKAKTEINLGSGVTLGGIDMFNYAKIAFNFKHVQAGFGLDIQTTNNVVEYSTPHVFVNAIFPVRYGYFYAGGHLGFTLDNPYGDKNTTVAVGGQAGVAVKICKWLYFNTELTNRIIMGTHRYENYYNNSSYSSFDMDMSIPITAGLKFRF